VEKLWTNSALVTDQETLRDVCKKIHEYPHGAPRTMCTIRQKKSQVRHGSKVQKATFVTGSVMRNDRCLPVADGQFKLLIDRK
jgi:hypothetical protein